MSTQLERFELHGERLAKAWSLLDCFECNGRKWVQRSAHFHRPGDMCIKPTDLCRRCGGSGKEALRG